MTWTDERDAIVREHYGIEPASATASRLGVTRNAIIGRARRLGLCKSASPARGPKAIRRDFAAEYRARAKRPPAPPRQPRPRSKPIRIDPDQFRVVRYVVRAYGDAKHSEKEPWNPAKEPRPSWLRAG